jgi:hypothetical protein
MRPWKMIPERRLAVCDDYFSKLKIYLARESLATYPLPADGVTNQRFSPPGLPTPPCQPNNRRHPSTEEENRLRALGPEVRGKTIRDASQHWTLPTLLSHYRRLARLARLI